MSRFSAEQQITHQRVVTHLRQAFLDEGILEEGKRKKFKLRQGELRPYDYKKAEELVAYLHDFMVFGFTADQMLKLF